MVGYICQPKKLYPIVEFPKESQFLIHTIIVLIMCLFFLRGVKYTAHEFCINNLLVINSKEQLLNPADVII